jgi:hypothetical protein
MSRTQTQGVRLPGSARCGGRPERQLQYAQPRSNEMVEVTSVSRGAWLAERWMAFIIVVVLLVISRESSAAPPPEPAPDDARETKPDRARKTGLGRSTALVLRF